MMLRHPRDGLRALASPTTIVFMHQGKVHEEGYAREDLLGSRNA